MKYHFLSILMMISLLGCVHREAEIADTVYINGEIYTVNAQRSWENAVAISDDKFVGVGTQDEMQQYIGDSTQVIDLNGAMVLPGLHDAHGHLLLGGLQFTSSCLLTEGISIDAIIVELNVCAEGKDPHAWLVAGAFWAAQFPHGKPDKSALDEAFPETPVYLHEGSVHHALVNSKALEIAGLDPYTAAPFGGSLPTNQEGELTGELLESATWLVSQHIPPTSAKTNLQALNWAIKQYNKHGITSVQEASANQSALEALRDAEEASTLNLQVAAHLILESPKFGQLPSEQLEQLFEERKQYESSHLAVDFVKMWIDGSPTPPYFTEAGFDLDAKQPLYDKILIPPERLSSILIRMDNLGVKVKMHVAGAGATHLALNAIAVAREVSPQSNIRHETGHSNLIIPDDFDRYLNLHVVAEMSPAIWHIFGATLGSPPQPAWQFRTILESGALMTTGSDWPVTPEPNFFPAIQGMLEHGAESIDLVSAIDTLTINGAISLGWDDKAGSIEVGKIANMIVLDRNIFDVPVQDIGKTRVLTTIFEGEVVYTAE